ncbi:MAG: DUF4268 domain-containing protein [Bacteroidales bacterium]
MYSREEAKAIREEFWDRFKKISTRKRVSKGLPGNWMLNHSGIRALNLRFHVDQKVAQVGIDLETRNMDKRLELYEKVEAVRKPLEEAIGGSLQWELEYIRENGKSVSRIYTEIGEVNIYDRATWPKAHRFMLEKMLKLELFYREYQDYFKGG